MTKPDSPKILPPEPLRLDPLSLPEGVMNAIKAAVSSDKPFLPGAMPRLENVQIIHPCTEFASSAGYSHWSEAVAAIEAGKIIAGMIPRGSEKTNWSAQLLFEQIHKIPEVFTVISEFGTMSVGLRSSFDPSTVKRIEAEREERFSR